MPFHSQPAPARRGKTPPPEDTHEELGYLKTLSENQTPVAVKLRDGETVYGWVEYYDRDMIRLTREGAPNLFIFKHEIMYISEGAAPARRPRVRNTTAADAGTPGAAEQ